MLKLQVEPITTNDNLYGKTAADLQSNVVVGDGEISGTSKYVTGYTQFSSNPAEQSGNYLALKATAINGATITFNGKTNVTLDADGMIVIILGENSKSVKFTATKNGKSESVTLSIAGLTKESAPQPQPTGLTPLAVGDVVVSGTTKVKVDKRQEIDTILDTLTEGEGPLFNLAMFEEEGGNQNACVLAIKMGTFKAIGVADRNSPTGKILYATEAMPDMGIVQGWQNLDENDEATIGESGTIDTISQGDVWNGVVIGKVTA